MDLFEDIKGAVGCEYISDIRFDRCKSKSITCALRLVNVDYPLSQWNDLVNYLFGEKTEFKCKQDVKQFLANKTIKNRIET